MFTIIAFCITTLFALLYLCKSVHDHIVLYNNIVRPGICESVHDHSVLYNNIVRPVIFM